MKKFLAVITALAVLTSLTACSDRTKQGGQTSTDQSADNSSGMSSDNSLDESSDTSEPENSEVNNSREPLTGKDLVAAFMAPDGKPVDLTGVPLTDLNDKSITVDELTEDNWFEIKIDGSAYLAQSGGIWYDSVTNADIYNADMLEFSGVPNAVKHEYKKYKVGDTFGELRITEASTSFMNFSDNPYYKYFNGSEVRFDGTLTLTGKMYMFPEAEGYIVERDLFFYPSAEDGKKIPLMIYNTNDDGEDLMYVARNGDTVFVSDSARLALGNMDSYTQFDFSGLPMDGTWVDVKITVGSVSFRNYASFTQNFTAEILDLEILS